MTAEINLSDYRAKCLDLQEIEPLQKCCTSFMEEVLVEPLEGRNTLEVDRSCIVECPDCGKQYVSKWD